MDEEFAGLRAVDPTQDDRAAVPLDRLGVETGVHFAPTTGHRTETHARAGLEIHSVRTQAKRRGVTYAAPPWLNDLSRTHGSLATDNQAATPFRDVFRDFGQPGSTSWVTRLTAVGRQYPFRGEERKAVLGLVLLEAVSRGPDGIKIDKIRGYTL